MASTHSAAMETVSSLKSTPDIEVNSLQLTQSEPKKSPSVSTVLSVDAAPVPTKEEKHHLPSVKLETAADETIQQILTQQVSPEKNKVVPSNVPSSMSTGVFTHSNTEAIATVPASGMANQPDSRKDSASSTNTKVSAYARLEFENFIFYVQTLQVVLGRKSENDQSHSVDVHLANSKAISRKHAKIFYNFGTERFELSIQGKNGAFVDDSFVERGATVPLTNKSKIQIGQIVFRFVLPGATPLEKTESPSKPINPSDAISLKSTLYTNQGNNDAYDQNGDASPLTSKDFEPVTSAKAAAVVASNAPSTTEVSASSSHATVTQAQPTVKQNTTESDNTMKKKEKKPSKPPKAPKKVYTLEEIPEEYRTKPNYSYSNLIATCLRTHGTPKGMSLAEIYRSIRDIFPYYKYCPDGWQSSVRHNLSLNKAFRKVSKEGKGWLWGLDEEYCAEKERAKKKQAAAAEAKAKAAALKFEQQQQQQQQKLQQRKSQTAQNSQHPSHQNVVQLPNTQGQQLPHYQLQNFQQNSITTPAKSEPLKNVSVNQPITSTPLQQGPQTSPLLQRQLPQQISQQGSPQLKTPSIQAQLAANRGIPSQTVQRPTVQTQTQQKSNMLGADTKKALTHLQQQLVLLSRDLKTLVDKPTISAILTQAIAMTIAQVTQAAKAKGLMTDPLATLIETNPQQLTKILTVALNAATFKVTNGRVKAPIGNAPGSSTQSRASTPAAAVPAPIKAQAMPTKLQSNPSPSPVHIKTEAQQSIPMPSSANQSPPTQLQPTQPSKSVSVPPAVQTPRNVPSDNGSSTAAPVTQHPQLIRGISSGATQQSAASYAQQGLTTPASQPPVAGATAVPLETNPATGAPPSIQPSNSAMPQAVPQQSTIKKDVTLDDIHDPEFDKVLESLSKEATPGLDEVASKDVIDDDELNRLLATDFTGSSSVKRKIDEVDSAVSNDNIKLVKTE